MSVKDNLTLLRTKGTAVTSTEAGWETLSRDTTGQIVVQIDKCPMEGIPIEVLATADTNAGSNASIVITIEASDELATEWLVVATFPTIVYSTIAALRFVRRVATQRKYLRSVITVTADGGSTSRFYEISVGIGLVDNDFGYTG